MHGSSRYIAVANHPRASHEMEIIFNAFVCIYARIKRSLFSPSREDLINRRKSLKFLLHVETHKIKSDLLKSRRWQQCQEGSEGGECFSVDRVSRGWTVVVGKGWKVPQEGINTY